MADLKTQPDVDPEQFENAQQLWTRFIKLTKYCCIAIAITLVLMALFLL